MSLILILSILIRLAAMVWAVLVMRWQRDWRIGFLGAMLALMATRQTLTLIARSDSWTISLTAQATELPGLVVSVMGFLAVVFVDRMLTDYQHTQARLAAEQSRFRGLIEVAPVGVQHSDLDGRITLSNSAHAAIHGCQTDDLVRRFVWDFQPTQESREQLKSYYQQLIEEQPAPVPYDGQNRTVDDRLIDVRVNWTYERDANGKLTGFVSLISDVTESRQLSEALRLSEEQYRGFVENSSEGIYLCEFDQPMRIDLPEDEQVRRLTTDCFIAICNDAFARMYGYESGQQMVGMRAIDLYASHENDSNTSFLRKMIRNDYRAVEQISEELDRDEHRVVFSNNCLGIVEDGHLMRVWGTQRDITQQVLAEELVIASQEKFEKAFRNSPDAILLTSLENGLLVEVNDTCCRISGYRREELIGQSTLELGLWDDPDIRAHYVKELQTAGRVVDLQAGFRTKGGELRYGLLAGEVISLRDGEFILGTIRDITARIEAERLLAEKEERLRDLFDNASDMIISVRPDGAIGFANRAWADTLGYMASEANDNTIFDFLAPNERERCQMVFARSLAGEEVGRIHTVFRTRGGEDILVEGGCSVSRDADGNATAVRGIFRDVTKQRQAQRFLELENALLGDVARGLSLEDGLVRLTDFIESQRDDVIASILLLDPTGTRLQHGAAPGLSDSFNQAVDGLAIGPSVGSCGTSAFLGKAVFVEDIESDPLWADYSELAQNEGVRSCWSTPILDGDGRVMGTFAIYRKVVGMPSDFHRQLIEAATQLASLFLSQHRNRSQLQESERRYRTIFAQAAVGVARLDSNTGEIYEFNDRYLEIMHARSEDLIGKTWMEITHPDDLEDLQRMEQMRAGAIRSFLIEKRLQRTK